MTLQTKPKITHHHTKDAKLAIRVRYADLIANKAITVEHWQGDASEFVFIRSVSKFATHQKTALGKTKSSSKITVHTSNGMFKAALWNARDIIDLLKEQAIPFEETLMVRELKGSTIPNTSGLASVLLQRLPQPLVRIIAWVIEDQRRYLVVTTGARNSFTKEDRGCILRSALGHTVIMTDSEEQAITIKIKHGGTLFDMQELRALA